MQTFLLVIILAAIFFFAVLPAVIAFYVGAPFVPTPGRAVQKVLEAAKIKKGEKIYDIGCGDGRFVHLASKKYGAEAVGFELSPPVYLLAKLYGLIKRSKAKIILGDSRNHSFREADKIICYLFPGILGKFTEKFEKELKKGTLIVSYAFGIPGWKPVKEIKRDAGRRISRIMVYEMGKHKA
ncbi:MAG: class I SAM-dependent methyltransferase [Patescibacteria group bacterium]|nr:class I SAM-dependent methyltransferase [Patescibacteria group bacterium]